MYPIRIVKDRSLSSASSVAASSKRSSVNAPNPWVTRFTCLASRFHVTPCLVQESNRLRCRISCVVPSFSNDPRSLVSVVVQRSQPRCKPYQIRHGSQHLEIITEHTNSQLFVFVVKKSHGDPWHCTNPIDPTNTLAISASQHMAASVLPYVASFKKPNLCT